VLVFYSLIDGDMMAILSYYLDFNHYFIHCVNSYEWTVPINVATAATSNWDNLLPSFYIDIGQSCELLIPFIVSS